MVALAGLLLLFSGRPLAAAEDAASLLAHMSGAVRDLDYQGSFIYEHEGRIDALRLFHAGGHPERERLVSLSGARSELVREGGAVSCLQSGRPTLVFPNRGGARLLPLLPSTQDRAFSKFYAAVMGASDRVAGYRARIVSIVPRDAYRYGYRLWLEDTTSLPLRSAVINAKNQVLEQFMFVALEVGARPRASDLAASSDTGVAAPIEEEALATAPHWRVTDAPPGFAFLRAQRPAQGARDAEHLIYTDGIANVSVYAEPRTATVQSTRVATRGVLSIYALDAGSWRITALGDVPPATVERIARSTRQVPAVR